MATRDVPIAKYCERPLDQTLLTARSNKDVPSRRKLAAVWGDGRPGKDGALCCSAAGNSNSSMPKFWLSRYSASVTRPIITTAAAQSRAARLHFLAIFSVRASHRATLAKMKDKAVFGTI